MPYLLGYGLVDASGNPLQDGSAADLAEPDTDMAWLAATVPASQEEVLTRIGTPASSVFSDLATIIAALTTTLNSETVTAIAILVDLLGYIKPLVTEVTAPGGWLGNQGAKLDDLLTRTGSVASYPTNLPDQLLAAIQAVRSDLTEPHLPTVQDVLTALAGLPLDPVTLPETPPAGYGGGATAADVWAYVLLNTGTDEVTADQGLSWAGEFARNIGNAVMLPLQDAPDFYIEAPASWYTFGIQSGAIDIPEPDYTDIRADDTVLSWLQRTEPNYTWQLSWAAHSDQCYAMVGTPGNYHYYLWCRLHDADLQALRGTPATVGPPVWPGIAGVTLGTPVALSTGLTIAEACDGVIVEITAVPTGTGKYQFDTEPSWVNLGSVAFYSDDDGIERGQSFSFEKHLLCPQTMAHAAGCYVRAREGTTGTITPWVVN